jgi:ABC-type molybdate transport system permease subunit
LQGQQRNTGKMLAVLAGMAYFSFVTAFPVFAAPGISDSKLARGTEKLIQDVTTWLMVLAPVVTGLLIIYFCIRRAAADEMDQKNGTTVLWWPLYPVSVRFSARRLSTLLLAITSNQAFYRLKSTINLILQEDLDDEKFHE